MIQLPNTLTVNVEAKDGPNATPHCVPVSAQGRAVLMTVGGLSKLEHTAALIAASLATENGSARRIAERSVEIAAAVLASCREATREAPKAT